MSVTLASWQRMWRELGAAQAESALFDRLVAAYSEKHRCYHTLQHLREVLESFEGTRHLAHHPAEVEVALWFHDAVYDVQASDNEARSADWAHRSVLEAGLGADVADRVHALVMATMHTGIPETEDARLLVDVDLAILGAGAARFDESDRQIREEYAHVPEAQFREGRCSILRSFLSRPRLYATELFYQRCEAQARQNLVRAMTRLSCRA
jgi:predicted metal-dependent HD superfamily phosphohydrolase